MNDTRGSVFILYYHRPFDEPTSLASWTTPNKSTKGPGPVFVIATVAEDKDRAGTRIADIG